MKRFWKLLGAVTLTSVLMPAQASATVTFDKPLTIVVPYSPGGTADFLVRRVAQSMSEDFSQSVVVENRPGAATAVAAASVSRANPDGYTILLASNATLAINQHRGVELNYSPTESFEYVSMLMSVQNVIVVPAESPYKTLQDMLDDSKKRSAPVTYGTMGIGTSNHIGTEVLARATGANLLHVAFPGSAPALTNLMGGHLDAVVDTLVATLPHINAGKLRPLATLGTKRSPLTPDVPTANEISGATEDFTAWFGFVVPKGTSADVIEALSRSAAKAVQSAEIREALETVGAEVVGSDPATFKQRVHQEQAMYAELLAPGNLDLE